MNAVKPIKDIALINEIEKYLKAQCERNYLLFVLGIYTALRISDMLPLRVIDVKNKDKIYVIEKKTSKENVIPVNEELKGILRRYCSGKRDYEYLFRSRKGENKPISRIQAYKILKKAAEHFNLENIGCHTTRKTFGYHLFYQEDKDIEKVQQALNHSNTRDTKKYIGLDEDSREESFKKLTFKYQKRY